MLALYDRETTSSPAPPAVSRIRDAWHHQRQKRHVCVLWPQARKVSGGHVILTFTTA